MRLVPPSLGADSRGPVVPPPSARAHIDLSAYLISYISYHISSYHISHIIYLISYLKWSNTTVRPCSYISLIISSHITLYPLLSPPPLLKWSKITVCQSSYIFSNALHLLMAVKDQQSNHSHSYLISHISHPLISLGVSLPCYCPFSINLLL